ncbi:MAG: hypothetical protein ACRBBV_09470 [Paracoccaceae bacterium]
MQTSTTTQSTSNTAPSKSIAKAKEQGVSKDGGDGDHSDSAIFRGENSGNSANNGQALATRYSEPLSRRLSSARTALLQSAMLKQPDVALRTLVLAMLHHSRLCGFRSGERFADAVQIRHNTTYGLTVTAPEIKDFRTLREVNAKVDYWTARFADERKDQTLEQSVFSLTGEEMSELLTLLVALSINAVTGREGAATAQPATALAQVLGFQARDGWKPTAASYFNHVPKKQILSDIQEFAPDNITELSKLTKSALADAAERLADKTDWVPLFMRQ